MGELMGRSFVLDTISRFQRAERKFARRENEGEKKPETETPCLYVLLYWSVFMFLV